MAGRPRSGADGKRRAGEFADVLAALYFAARRDYEIDLSHRAVRVLQLVAFSEAPPRIDDVARFLDCAASTASELVKRLQGKGLIARRRSDADERVVCLALTDAGRSALAEHTSLDPVKLRAGLRSLPASDQEALVRLLGELTRGLLDDRSG